MPGRRGAAGSQDVILGDSRGAGRPRATGGVSKDPETLTKPPATKKRPKYGNTPTVIDGQRFASKREAARYQLLKFSQDAGKITDLRCQVPFDLHAPGGQKIGRYVADFTYTWVAPDAARQHYVEDAKGVRTPLYKWKKIGRAHV